jgi:hypothetical protein
MRRGALAAVLLAAACASGKPSTAGKSVAAVADGSRIMVEVLNATPRRGLARIGTRALREAGFDVVFFAGADTTLDSTLVLVRRGALERGERVAKALGRGRLRMAPDTLRRVDVSVLLGKDYRPPPDLRP